MAKYQKKLNLESVAAKRGQTLTQLLTDWSVTSLEDLKKRCKREGVEVPANFTFALSSANVEVMQSPPRNALIDLSKESEDVTGKKRRKSKLTHDEPIVNDEHIRLDPDTAAGSKDAT